MNKKPTIILAFNINHLFLYHRSSFLLGQMDKIYTRQGDYGKTTLRPGVRVEKDDPRIEANGETDQLNALLGIVKSLLAKEDDEAAFIGGLQKQLISLMAYVTTSAKGDCKAEEYLQLTTQMEKRIDGRVKMPAFHFDLPGRCPANGILHLARTQCRTVERRLWTLSKTYPLDGSVFKFINRMSDYLFALAVSV